MRLVRRLDPRLSLIRTPAFPARHRPSALRYEAVIGLGGNIGDVPRRFERLIGYWRRLPFVDVVATAPVLKNPPFGFSEQEDFSNSVVVVRTALPPRAFMRFLLRTERRFGRTRSFANAPRTLDLDLLFFDGRKIEAPGLTVPHPHWHERESVLIPLALLPGGRR